MKVKNKSFTTSAFKNSAFEVWPDSTKHIFSSNNNLWFYNWPVTAEHLQVETLKVGPRTKNAFFKWASGKKRQLGKAGSSNTKGHEFESSFYSREKPAIFFTKVGFYKKRKLRFGVNSQVLAHWYSHAAYSRDPWFETQIWQSPK